MKCSTIVNRAASSRLDYHAGLMDGWRIRRRQVHEIERLRNLGIRRGAYEDAARGERICEECEPVIGILTRGAEQRERGIRVALEQDPEIDDFEARGNSAVRKPRIEAAVGEHDPVRALDRKQPRREALPHPPRHAPGFRRDTRQCGHDRGTSSFRRAGPAGRAR